MSALGLERTGRSTLHLALAGLLATVCAATTLRPLLSDLAWAPPTALAVVAVVLTGVAVRQLGGPWPVAAAAQAVVLLVVLTVRFAGDQALLGVVPTAGSIRALGAGLQQGVQLIGESAAPAPTAPGMVLMVALGVGVIALVVDLVAAGSGRPAAAGLALLAIYCVPATVLPFGVSWVYFVIAAAGYLVLVGADSLDRIHGWGQVLGEEEEPRWTGTAPLQGGRRVAAVSLVAAVLVPLVTPGIGERWLNSDDDPGQGRGNGRISVINPILSLRQNLTTRNDVVVITYTTTMETPEPIRIASDDAFDGETWAPSVGPISRSQRVQEGLPDPPGLGPDVATTELETSLRVGELSQTYLPLPYPTTRVEIDGDWLYEQASLNVVGDGQRTDNTSYTATHLQVSPTAEQLNQAGPASAEFRDTFTALPGDLPQEIGDRATEVAGQGSDYQKALNLQDFLRESGGFTYDENAPGSDGNDSGTDAVLDFLQDKRGYCVHFASTMAVMARTLDIPSRVAVGFLPGDKVGEEYQVSLRDAHAWPELFFEGIGWTRFEPTPANRVPDLPGYTQPEVPEEQEAAAPSATASAAPSAEASQQAQPAETEATDESSESGSTSWWQRIPWELFAALGVLLLVAAVPLTASLAARRIRWARVHSGTQAAEAAWDELRERLDDLGVRWARSWTPRALAHRLGVDHDLAESDRAALTRLSGDLEGSRYAPPGQDPGRDPETVRSDVDAVVRAVAAGRDPGVQRRARWFPRSGLTALGRVVTGQAGGRRDEESLEPQHEVDAVPSAVPELTGRDLPEGTQNGGGAATGPRTRARERAGRR